MILKYLIENFIVFVARKQWNQLQWTFQNPIKERNRSKHVTITQNIYHTRLTALSAHHFIFRNAGEKLLAMAYPFHEAPRSRLKTPGRVQANGKMRYWDEIAVGDLTSLPQRLGVMCSILQTRKGSEGVLAFRWITLERMSQCVRCHYFNQEGVGYHNVEEIHLAETFSIVWLGLNANSAEGE